MDSSSSERLPMIVTFVSILLLLHRHLFLLPLPLSLTLVVVGARSGGITVSASTGDYSTLQQPSQEIITAHLRRLNKPSAKTIESPDGDLIDCVPSHLQPAFDHPKLKEYLASPFELPDQLPKPKGFNLTTTDHDHDHDHASSGIQQAWAVSGESCPEGTIPIRRTTAADLLRAAGNSLRGFGRKTAGGSRRGWTTGDVHKHAVGYVEGSQYYGAQASLNVWSPRVATSSELSLSQLWVISGSFDNDDLNTIEAGWQVSPDLYGDNRPRLFTYWTSDAYQETGCYNLWCSGFVQTSNKVAIGASISPVSAYNARQFDIGLLVWKDPKRGNWWLQLGSEILVGYWPALLFSHLSGHASMVQFGGEVVSGCAGRSPATQMGSGHFAREGFGRAAYFRNLQVVDWGNNLIPAPNLRFRADHPNCYSIIGGGGSIPAWGTYFYYGGPGPNAACS